MRIQSLGDNTSMTWLQNIHAYFIPYYRLRHYQISHNHKMKRNIEDC